MTRDLHSWEFDVPHVEVEPVSDDLFDGIIEEDEA